MNQNQAERLAALLDEITGAAGAHEAWNSGGGIWLVQGSRDSAGGARPQALIVYSGDAICEYVDDAAFEAGRATVVIEIDSMIPDPNADRR